LRYGFSAAGDLLLVEDSRRGRVEYHCDAAHRLKLAKREDVRNELYAHDKAGNLILQPGLDGVKVGAGNKLKQANGERFYYDHRDNVVMRESERKTTSYEYDSFDQLVGISLNGREWQADYDALGRRTRKRWAGQTTEYYWDHDRLSGEIRGDGSVRVYVFADERALIPFLYVDYASLEAEPESGLVKYLFTNHLGVPERVEDSSGRTIWQGEVLPYGMVRVELGRLDEVNLRSPGHHYDVETGLHYNRFRYYDPVLGRYLQCDPLGIAGGFNLYAYVSNPLIGVDILGLNHPAQEGRSDSTARNEGRDGHQRDPRASISDPPIHTTQSGKVTTEGYTYSFDESGRVTSVEGSLKLDPGKRNTKAQREAGGRDRRSTDQGGHWIARIFGPPSDDFNHYAQNGNFNMGAYRVLEKSWADTLASGKDVEVLIEGLYPGNSRRPDSILVWHSIDGVPQDPIVFGNNPKGLVEETIE
jgi:RHS repeat-associated protein